MLKSIFYRTIVINSCQLEVISSKLKAKLGVRSEELGVVSYKLSVEKILRRFIFEKSECIFIN